MFKPCSFSHNSKFNGFEQTWHKCLGHAHQRHMIIISKHHSTISLLKTEPLGLVCEAFIINKKVQGRAPRQSFHWSKTSLEIIHNDICGPLSQSSIIGTLFHVH